MKRYTLNKNSRLKSQKDITEAFGAGKSLQVYPLRVYYAFSVVNTADLPSIKSAFAVPKRNFKQAVKRNQIKRQMREAFRLNQYLLRDKLSLQSHLNLVWLYFVKDQLKYPDIEKATQKLLMRLVKELKHDHD